MLAALVITKPPNFRRSSPRQGFTLVEIMVVVVIIGLLAALALPAFQRVQTRSRASRLANDFRQFDAGFQRYMLESGTTPAAGGVSTVPAGMDGYLPPAFTQPSPYGGGYIWSGPSRNVVLTGSSADDTVMQAVDRILDDGDLSTGNFTKIAAGYGLKVP